MSNIRLADPFTLNGRSYLSLDAAANAVYALDGIDGTSRYSILVGVAGIDLATQTQGLYVAKYAPLVKNAGGKYQFQLDTTVMATWFTAYQTIAQVMPGDEDGLCRVFVLVGKDVPEDLAPSEGDFITDPLPELFQCMMDVLPALNSEHYVQCAVMDAVGDVSYPVLMYQNTSDMFSIVGAHVNCLDVYFGGYMKRVLVKNTDIANWYIKFNVPMTTPGEYSQVELIIKNPYFVQPS